ncbi:hypothetical protein [Geodermatophilus sp. CPCC 205506]|uniref:hypothetical protein n=1 Tax=Geodermatophilus sp. CPCC 205506 TaxID=2936596 RepID=UPI003EED2F34
MTCDQVRDVDAASVPVVGEAEMAEHLHRAGRRVVLHRGRHWEQLLPGFFRPVHLLARLTRQQATRPARACWGFQACLVDGDASEANAGIPVHLISDLGAFDEDTLPQSRRYRLRKARKRARFVELTGPALLREQGFEVLRSSQERTGYGSLPSRDGYDAALSAVGRPAQGVVLAGLVDGRLGGYLTGHAVDGTAYLREIVVATEALGTDMSTALTYEFIYACGRSEGIREVVHGLHAREDDGLCRHKELLGIPLQRVPAKVVMLPGAAALIRRRNPHKYYRLTGRG